MPSLYQRMALGVINYARSQMSRWKPDAAGRLIKAAITLFAEQGYEETTVAEIAERAGLTKRTFFRYFSDKREVLFSGSEELERLWLEAVAAAPPEATPLAVVTAGLDPVAEMFIERHDFARIRAADHRGQPGTQGARADQASEPRRCDQGGAGRARLLRECGDPCRTGGRDRVPRGVCQLGGTG